MSITIKGLANRVSRFAAALGLLAVTGTAAAQSSGENAIERIDAIQTTTGVVVSIELKNPVSGVPPSFSVANPARVALDLPQTVNALGKNLVELNQGDVRSVNVVQAGGRSRVVVNLKRSVTHNVTVDGKRVLVALGGAAGATFAGAPAPAAATAAGAPVAAQATAGPGAFTGGRSLRGIDFRRGADNEGRVVIDLSDPNTNVDIRQQGNTVVVDFLNTTLPDTLKRRLDVSDFATPVSQISASQQGNNARLVVEPRGLWEHNAYQSDTRFVLEVRPVKEDPSRLFQGSRQGYQGERLSLNFQNVDVRSLLQVIADFTNLNIITSDSVGGTITLRLKDVPWDQALDIILQSKGLDMRKNGNVILVAPRDEIATKEKLDLESRNQIAELEPLRSEAFVVNYQKAEDVRRLLTDDKQRLLSKRGTRRGRSAHQPAVRAGHGGPARGRAPPAAAGRRGRPAGADRGADRRSRRQVQPQPRRAPRLRQVPTTSRSSAARTSSARSRVRPGSVRTDPEQRQPAGERPERLQSGPVQPDAVQQQPDAPDQPRTDRARGRWPRQGHLQSARRHGRQGQGDDRAGHGDSVPAGHVERGDRRSRSARPS